MKNALTFRNGGNRYQSGDASPDLQFFTGGGLGTGTPCLGHLPPTCYVQPPSLQPNCILLQPVTGYSSLFKVIQVPSPRVYEKTIPKPHHPKHKSFTTINLQNSKPEIHRSKLLENPAKNVRKMRVFCAHKFGLSVCSATRWQELFRKKCLVIGNLLPEFFIDGWPRIDKLSASVSNNFSERK
jgi:hypothetical protein